jgi:hypothetical protein
VRYNQVMDKPEFDIAEGWAAVEIEYPSGGRQWYVLRQEEVDGFINVHTSMGYSLSDVDDTTQYCAAEAYSAWLYINDETVRKAEDDRRRTRRIFGGRQPYAAPIPDDVVTLEDIVAELKRREVALGLREA